MSMFFSPPLLIQEALRVLKTPIISRHSRHRSPPYMAATSTISVCFFCYWDWSYLVEIHRSKIQRHFHLNKDEHEINFLAPSCLKIKAVAHLEGKYGGMSMKDKKNAFRLGALRPTDCFYVPDVAILYWIQLSFMNNLKVLFLSISNANPLYFMGDV
ncbi:unnamed protein product [Lactuca virosa]|uniref:Uncharacterized protein n=1 Tax=Lactuca virosa TaxID=75947 RepID=A0AAU9MXF7_9ASTR|nr:unnamed protein product [Lactuca virosa]